MKEFVVKVVPDEAIEIVLPNRSAGGARCSVFCLCCGRTDRPMDDDGCGICDICIGLPLRATDDPDGPEVRVRPTSSTDDP